jgi:hypothetical protein
MKTDSTVHGVLLAAILLEGEPMHFDRLEIAGELRKI